ncbi:MAG: hypothetical protein L0Z62_27685 [Gemmataceae bacterium]|nr:hypothetical protein [Gemmataceae bacterium]
MDKDNDYYRTLDLRCLAKAIPRDKEVRGRAEAFHEMLIALALRLPTEPFTAADLLAYLGEPDSVERTDNGEVWEYFWLGEHCSREYRSSTPFIVKEGQVVGIRRPVLTPAS